MEIAASRILPDITQNRKVACRVEIWNNVALIKLPTVIITTRKDSEKNNFFREKWACFIHEQDVGRGKISWGLSGYAKCCPQSGDVPAPAPPSPLSSLLLLAHCLAHHLPLFHTSSLPPPPFPTHELKRSRKIDRRKLVDRDGSPPPTCDLR